MVKFGPPNTVLEKFKDRKFYQHNPTVTLMRTTVDENRKLGEEIGCKAAAATGPTSIVIPLKGVSAIDQTGKAFDDPTARQALYEEIRATHGNVELIEVDNHINDATFASVAAEKLLSLIGPRSPYSTDIDHESYESHESMKRDGVLAVRIIHHATPAGQSLEDGHSCPSHLRSSTAENE